MGVQHVLSAIRGPLGIVDILVVAYLIYRLLLLVRGTRALQILLGLGTLLLAMFISQRLHLDTLHWLLIQVVPLGPVAIVILFYPELRHALEEFGPRFWSRGLGLLNREDVTDAIEAVVAATEDLSAESVGALIVFERQTGLDEAVNSGVPLDSTVTAQLLKTIFYKGTPLHDGAVIIRSNRIVAAACTLPLTDRPKIDATVHTRHKAAIGMSDNSDAVIVVVSEETGTISIAVEGHLLRGQSPNELHDRLIRLLNPTDNSVSRLRDNFRDRVGLPH